MNNNYYLFSIFFWFVVIKLRDYYGILILLAGNKNQYIRILPPLNISEEEVNQFVSALRNILYSYNK